MNTDFLLVIFLWKTLTNAVPRETNTASPSYKLHERVYGVNSLAIPILNLWIGVLAQKMHPWAVLFVNLPGELQNYFAETSKTKTKKTYSIKGIKFPARRSDIKSLQRCWLHIT